MDWLKFGLALLKAWNGLVALLRSWRDKEAGRNEVILDVKENSDAALNEADLARRDSDAANSVGGQLRESDGFRRD
jgi:hypothetical protein